jgi:two-component system, LytTR family, response regulator
MRLRAYLVDDEPLAIARLTRLLGRTGRVDVIGSATDPEEAVDVLSTTVPDVCFLDIQMPRLNGFEMLARLPVQPNIVFTTAHDRYALQAFAFNSVDYLLKSLTDSLRSSQPDYPERIASRLGDRLWFLDLASVTHFFAGDKLTYAVESGKSYSVDYTIVQLESILDPKRFVRIHRGTLVNTAWIKEVTTLPGGGLNVRLKDARSTDLTVSRDRAREFKSRLLVK